MSLMNTDIKKVCSMATLNGINHTTTRPHGHTTPCAPQVVEWGDIATLVSVDTRGVARSSDYIASSQVIL